MDFPRSLVVVAGVLSWPSAAVACSCTWFFGSVDEARLRAAAAPVHLIVVGKVVGETSGDACRGPAGVPVRVYRTLKIDQVIKGSAPASIEVDVGQVIPSLQGCSQAVTSCDVRPGLGAKGVWALMRNGQGWQFAGVCTTDAVRRVAALDKKVRADEAGGEIDSVRRHQRMSD